MALNLRTLHAKQAQRTRKAMSNKLRQGKGLDGRQLARKVNPNNRPLGFGKSRAGIPGRIDRAPIRAFQRGFDIDLADSIGDLVFDTGRANQVARKIYGIPASLVTEFAEELLDEFRKEGVRLKVFKRGG